MFGVCAERYHGKDRLSVLQLVVSQSTQLPPTFYDRSLVLPEDDWSVPSSDVHQVERFDWGYLGGGLSSMH